MSKHPVVINTQASGHQVEKIIKAEHLYRDHDKTRSAGARRVGRAKRAQQHLYLSARI